MNAGIFVRNLKMEIPENKRNLYVNKCINYMHTVKIIYLENITSTNEYITKCI